MGLGEPIFGWWDVASGSERCRDLRRTALRRHDAVEAMGRRLRVDHLRSLVAAAGTLRPDPAEPLGIEAKEVAVAAARDRAASAGVVAEEVAAVADGGWSVVSAISRREIERLVAELGEWFALADEANRHLPPSPRKRKARPEEHDQPVVRRHR